MARASWGSTSGDLSGLFATLQNDWQNRVQASVNRDMARSAEQQAANDADAYDKWTNGKMSDEEWLAYIQSRVDATAGDPKQHEQWMETLRKHQTAIEDARAESAYTNGTMSIDQLIAHYSDRMKGVEKNSPEYRTQEARYYDLVDKRDSDLIDTQSSAILARINRGQAGYKELLAYYQSALSKTRASSPLYSQLQKNIQSIKDIVDGVTGRSGTKGSGGGGGGANAYSTASKKVLELWNSGNVFVPGGADVVKSVLDVYNTDLSNKTDVWNALGEDSVVIEQLLDYGTKNPDAPYMVTPWGDKIPNTLENRHLLMNQGLRGYDYRIALGNATGRSVIGVLGARDSFVNNTFAKENSATASQYWGQVRQNAWERMELASQDPNPANALAAYADAGAVLEDAANRILGSSVTRTVTNKATQAEGTAGQINYGATTLFPEQQVDDKMKSELQYAIQLAEFAKNSPGMTPEEAQHQASMLLDGRPDGFWLSETDLRSVLGSNVITASDTGFGNDPKVGTGIIGKSYAKRGLDAGAMLEAGGVSPGVEPYRYIGKPGQTPMAVPESSINDVLGTQDYRDGSTRGGWEKVGNATVWVIRPLEAVKTPQWWFNSNTQKWMTADQAKSMDRSAKALADAGWSKTDVPGLSGWSKVTDGDGRNWYVDPEDGHLYPDAPPFKAGVLGPVFDYADFVSKDGSLDMEKSRLSASTGRGYVAFFGDGVSTREAQQLTDQAVSNPTDDKINLEFFHNRDPNNHVSFDPISPADVAGMYWSASDPLVMVQSRKGPGGWQVGKTAIGAEDVKNLAAARVSDRIDQLARDEFRRKAQVQAWQDQQLSAQVHSQIQQIPDIMGVRDQVMNAAQAAGISLGTQMPKQMPAPTLNPVTPPSSYMAPNIAPVSLSKPTIAAPKIPTVPNTAPIPSGRYAGKPVPL